MEKNGKKWKKIAVWTSGNFTMCKRNVKDKMWHDVIFYLLKWEHLIWILDRYSNVTKNKWQINRESIKGLNDYIIRGYMGNTGTVIICR